MLTIQNAFALALRHHQAGRAAAAEAIYRQILAVQPSHVKTLHHLGILAHQQGHHAEGRRLVEKALVNDPTDPAIYSNLGTINRSLNRLDEAVAAYQRAIELNADLAQAHYNLGIVLVELGRSDEAVAAFERALDLQPDYPEANSNLGTLLRDRGSIDSAISAYRRAVEQSKTNPWIASNLIYALHFHPHPKPGAIAEAQDRWNRQFSDPVKPLVRRPVNPCAPERPLRIGYVSPDLRDHTIGRNLAPLFARHDRRQFEVFFYSETSKPDAVTAQIRQHASRWRETANLSDDSLSATIRSDGIDVLVDLAQHTSGNRLPVFTREPAPVQVSFAGYPESAGLDSIGQRISDQWLEKGGELDRHGLLVKDDSREKVYLIGSFWFYDPCSLELPLNRLPLQVSGMITFGSLNNFCKVNEPLLKLWARVMNAVSNSTLVLLSHAGSHRQRTMDLMEAEGVSPTRIEFKEPRPRKDYLELYHRIDAVLDTFPYNGHTTSLDALWMGVPVVSLCGERPVSRAGLSQLTNLGLPELVAHSEDEYVKIAVDLANDIPRLTELRATLRQRMEKSVLMDAPHFARQIEAAYRAMWRDWCEKQRVD